MKQQAQAHVTQKVADGLSQQLHNPATTEFLVEGLLGKSQGEGDDIIKDVTKSAVKGAVSVGIINGDTVVKGFTTLIQSGGDTSKVGSAIMGSMSDNFWNIMNK